MPAAANLVHVTTATTGTGDFTVSVVNGKNNFASAFGTGATPDVFDYFASSRDATQWERGTGHMSDATTLVRDTVLENSLGNTSKIDFTTATIDITNDYPAASQYHVGGTDVAVADGGTGASTAADARTNLGLVIGTNVQAYDADLTTWAGLTPSANAQSLVTAANYAAMRGLLDLEAGTDFYSIAAADAAFQPKDAQLTDVAGLTPTDNGVIIGNGANFVVESGATLKTSLGLTIGTDVQAYDAELAAIAGLTSAADKGIQFTGSGTAATYDLTTAGKALLDDADASAQRTTLGLGTAAVKNTGTSGNTVPLLDGANTFSAAQSISYGSAVFTVNGTTGTATLNISRPAGHFGGVYWNTGSDNRWAALVTNTAETGSDAGSNFIFTAFNDVGASLGDVYTINRATQVLNFNVAPTFTNASAARTNLGLAIGTNVQAYDATLTAFAAYNTNGLLTQTAADTFAGRTLTGTANQITVSNGDGVSGNPTLSLPADVIIPTVITAPNTGLHILDTNASHDLIIKPGSDLSADRTLTVTTGDADRTLTVSASATVSQDYSTTGNPQFATIELGAASDTTLARSSAGNVTIEGNLVYRAGGTDVPVTDGGTGSSTAAGAATNLGLGTGDSPQFTAVNIGHATDTTLTRVSAGVVAVEGNNLARVAVLRTYTTSDTWSKPSTLIGIVVEAVGGGGAGGGGARTASGNASSGGGGGGGAAGHRIFIPAANLAATETVTVGAGGTGGNGATSDGNAGSNGTAGGNSSFGSFFTVYGGGYGAGGQLAGNSGGGGSGSLIAVGGNASGATAGTGAANGGSNGGSGGGGSFSNITSAGGGGGINATAGTTATGGTTVCSTGGGAGGGAGGGIAAAPANTAGGAGGMAVGAVAGTAGSAAGAGGTPTAANPWGAGGGGGGGNASGVGGAGGTGGGYGGGGGGGGSAVGGNGGRGGDGGSGVVRIWEIY